MGGPSSTANEWKDYTTKKNLNSKSVDEIYTSSRCVNSLNPLNFEFRESRDNEYQPITTPIILGVDNTGSMDHLLEELAKGIGKFAGDIYEKNIVVGPQICIMSIGDVYTDNTPLQVTQFESDIRIAEQLQQIHFEKRGGGNGSESYPLAWYYAACHTMTDSYEKRNKKGIMITIGNDGQPDTISGRHISRFLNKEYGNVSSKDLYEMVSKKYETFHIHLSDGLEEYPDFNNAGINSNRAILGDNLIIVDDVKTIPEVLIALCMKLNGSADDDIVTLIDSPKAKDIADSLKAVAVVNQNASESKLVRL